MEQSLLQIPQQYWPPMEDLPRDMQTMAESLEQDFPGQGMLITLSLAQRIGGAWYYVRKLDEMPKAWRNDTIRKMYDSGEHTAKDLSRIWRLSHRQVQNILAETGKGTVSRALEEKQMKLFEL
jgi:Mor family transcriptional regulator